MGISPGTDLCPQPYCTQALLIWSLFCHRVTGALQTAALSPGRYCCVVIGVQAKCAQCVRQQCQLVYSCQGAVRVTLVTLQSTQCKVVSYQLVAVVCEGLACGIQCTVQCTMNVQVCMSTVCCMSLNSNDTTVCCALHCSLMHAKMQLGMAGRSIQNASVTNCMARPCSGILHVLQVMSPCLTCCIL